jgi:ligand-binding SRPBCC domain-containing protein
MDEQVAFEMVSKLHAPRELVWTWMTSVHGISEEMRPYFRMTAPDGVKRLSDLGLELGKPIFRSKVFLFNVLPAGSWDFVLVELDEGRGFVEDDPPSTFMKKWRHERRLLDCPDDASAVLLMDRVSFTPKSAPLLVGPFIQRVFKHRHRVLQKHFARSN